MLRCLLGGRAKSGNGFGVLFHGPVRAAQPCQCFRVPGSKLECVFCRCKAGMGIASVEFSIRQHHPGDEIRGVSGYCVAQCEEVVGRGSSHVSGMQAMSDPQPHLKAGWSAASLPIPVHTFLHLVLEFFFHTSGLSDWQKERSLSVPPNPVSSTFE
jgi:hypothetical protein